MSYLKEHTISLDTVSRLRRGAKCFGFLCKNLYTSKAVLNIEQCSIGNQWRVFLTGVMCEYFVVLVTILARIF